MLQNIAGTGVLKQRFLLSDTETESYSFLVFGERVVDASLTCTNIRKSWHEM